MPSREGQKDGPCPGCLPLRQGGQPLLAPAVTQRALNPCNPLDTNYSNLSTLDPELQQAHKELRLPRQFTLLQGLKQTTAENYKPNSSSNKRANQTQRTRCLKQHYQDMKTITWVSSHSGGPKDATIAQACRYLTPFTHSHLKENAVGHSTAKPFTCLRDDIPWLWAAAEPACGSQALFSRRSFAARGAFAGSSLLKTVLSF